MTVRGGTKWAFLRRLLAAGLLLAAATCPAFSDEFERYKKADAQKFAQGVTAYDAGRYQEAFDIWLPLARHLDIAAIYNVGLMLRDGRGVQQDLPRALTFFKKAAEVGHVGAEVNVADMYYQGRGAAQDYVEAAKWLMLLSRRGHLPSMYKLAGMFERGEGIEANLKAARTLYIIAYRSGYQPAGNRLAELAAKSNEARAGPESITPPQVAIAMLPVPNPGDAPASGVLFQLRGTIGAGGEAVESAADPIWSLRESFAAMSAVERQIYRIGWTAKTVKGRSDTGSGLRPPRICSAGPRPFDAPLSMCRMPPIGD